MTEETQEKEYWSVEDLEALTDTVQTEELDYQGKLIKISWWGLTEREEPKVLSVDESLSEDEKNAQYLDLAKERVSKMMSKAQEKQPDDSVLKMTTYEKLPASAKYMISNKILGVELPNEQ